MSTLDTWTPTLLASEPGSQRCISRNRIPRSGRTIYIYLFGRGKTPHQVAREFGHAEVFEFLNAPVITVRFRDPGENVIRPYQRGG